MTLKNGSRAACAACKYQRRRCASDCPLSPYFPADQPKLFQNAHKLFGLRNILRILKKIDPNQKAEAMHSIIYQSCVRDRFPVHGCLGVTHHLKYIIWLAEEELEAVNAQLKICRQQQQQIPQLPDNDETRGFELCMAPPNNNNNENNSENDINDSLSLFDVSPIEQQQEPQVSYSYSCSNICTYSPGRTDSKEDLDTSPLWIQHQDPNNDNNNCAVAIQSQLVASQALAIQHELVHDYDEIHPFFDKIDDSQSYIDSKDPYDSGAEESLKNTTGHGVEYVAENELKNAAACFTLTSVN